MLESDKKTRPYWHVDLKWIFGILSILCLSITLTLFSLSHLMSERIAIPLATYVVASQFSRDGLDDAKDMEALKEELLLSGEEVFYPFEGNEAVAITKTDIETLSPRELRLKIFRQIVEPYYYGGIDQATDGLNLSPEQKKDTASEIGLLAFFNIETHQKLQELFLTSIIPLVIFLAGLVIFSHRYGKLISPAVVFLLVSTPFTIILFLMQQTTPPPNASGPLIPDEVLRNIAIEISAGFYMVFVMGISLIPIALVTKIILTMKHKNA